MYRYMYRYRYSLAVVLLAPSLTLILEVSPTDLKAFEIGARDTSSVLVAIFIHTTKPNHNNSILYWVRVTDRSHIVSSRNKSMDHKDHKGYHKLGLVRV